MSVRARLHSREAEPRRSVELSSEAPRTEQIDREVTHMRVYWERIGLLGPIYRLVGKGLNDREIANKLNVTETKVQGCLSWMLHSFKIPSRMELARDAFNAEHSTQRAQLKGG